MKNKWLKGFLQLIFPSYCVVCGYKIIHSHNFICINCLRKLPVTNYHLELQNEMEKRFWGIFTPEKAAAYFYFIKGSGYERILYELKYFGGIDLAKAMGRMMALEFMSSGFFQGIDLIIPIPLHKDKKKKRGYNQSELIANGISEITGIEVSSKIVLRSKYTSTQTRKRILDRWENVEQVFAAYDDISYLQNKHILVIDDVMTSGATITACVLAIKEKVEVKCSILTLAVV